MKSILLLGDNYISELLVQTAFALKIPILCKNIILKDLQSRFTKVEFKSIDKLTSFSLNENFFFYTNSEDCLVDVINFSKNKYLKNGIKVFKDKYKFRELISPLYPNFYYKKLKINDLDSYKIKVNKPIILKPVKGFFGTGVQTINNQSEWNQKIQLTKADVKKNSKYFSEDILDHTSFIVEEKIIGEEYAVDMFFDENKKVQIVNIYHHPYRDSSDTRNVLYYSNVEIIKKLKEKVTNIFNIMNKKLYLKNFPIHAEFRQTKLGELIPIEMNPLRFGGFGLADLSYYGYEFNPFEVFFQSETIQWENICNKKRGQEIGWILAYNASLPEQFVPDHDKFKKQFSKILHYNIMNHKKYPVFSQTYATSNNISEFRKFLKIDFSQFYKLASDWRFKNCAVWENKI